MNHVVRPFKLGALERVCERYWRSPAQGQPGHGSPGAAPSTTPPPAWSVRDRAFIVRKRQVRFLASHLGNAELGCQTLVLEPEFIDPDYLDDYAHYYVRCNASYGRKCLRVHFFRPAFTQSEYDGMLRDPQGTGRPLRSALEAPGAYLGFVVLRPLPEAFVGTTCLATYAPSAEDDRGRRERRFPALKTHPVHLAGLRLEVRSLSYQEQDNVVAACATVATWCALKKASPLFELAVPSPAEITRRAVDASLSPSRGMPSKGLMVYDICRVIRSLGLEVELRDVEDATGADGSWRSPRWELRQFVHAYGSLGLPIILGLVDGSDRHAVTVCGYALDADPGSRGRPAWERMRQLYLHDDQVGPYVRAPIQADDQYKLEMPGHQRRGQKWYPRIAALLVPVHRLVRVRMEDVLKACSGLERLLPVEHGTSWDVTLSAAEDCAREALAETSEYTPEQRAGLATFGWPSFVWKATGWSGAEALLDVFVDATDIAESFLPIQIALRSAGRERVAPQWRSGRYRDQVSRRIRGITAEAVPDIPAMPYREKTWRLIDVDLQRCGTPPAGGA